MTVRSTTRRWAALALALASFGVTPGESTTASGNVKEIHLTAPGPRGPVTVIGDSVLLGAGLNSPTLPDQLAARGWGPIRFRAAGSGSSGFFGVANEFRSSFWIDLWQSQGWDPKHVIVNVGVNDSGLCNASVSCAYASIMHMVDAIGPGHEIWWPTIVKSQASHHISFNTALRQVESERTDFHIWDWYTEYVQGGYVSGDEIHLDPAGYRRRSAVLAQAFTDDFSTARRTGGDVPLPTPLRPVSTYVSMPPSRIADSRSDPATRVSGGSRWSVDLDAVIPEDATAVALYVAAARPSANGYLSAGPCDSDTSGSTVNFAAGIPRGAPTITALGASRTVCIFASVDTDVVVDVQGVFVAGDSGVRMTPLQTPRRVHDTRETGRLETVVVDVGTDVDAVAVNLGAARASAVGYLSAAPCDEVSGTANVNFSPGPAVSASAIVPVDDDGRFCIFASESVDVIVDLTAEFSATGSLAYQAITPVRTVDTRFGLGGWTDELGSSQTIDIGAAPATAAAVSGTIAMIRPAGAGFLAAHGCTGTVSTASLNATGGSIAANSVTSVLSDGRLCITSSTGAHVIFDTNGWWVTG